MEYQTIELPNTSIMISTSHLTIIHEKDEINYYLSYHFLVNALDFHSPQCRELKLELSCRPNHYRLYIPESLKPIEILEFEEATSNSFFEIITDNEEEMEDAVRHSEIPRSTMYKLENYSACWPNISTPIRQQVIGQLHKI